MRRYRLWTEPLSHTSVTQAQQRLKLPDSCAVVTWEWSQFTALQRRWAFPLSVLSCSCAGGWRR